MTTYFVDDLQAVEPDELAKEDGIVITISPEKDSMGFDRVEVEAPTREQLLDYVAREWGVVDGGEVVGDIGWFNEWVRDRVIVRDPEPIPAEEEEVALDVPRTILCHLNVEVAAGARFSVAKVRELIDGALEVGLEGNDDAEGLIVEIALCEEVG